MSINESSMWAAVHRMESASEQMARAAEEITQAVQRFAFLLEPGYGGNGLRLIELLEQTAPQPEQSVLAEALEQYANDSNWCYDTCNVSRDVAKRALAAYRAALSAQGESHE